MNILRNLFFVTTITIGLFTVTDALALNPSSKVYCDEQTTVNGSNSCYISGSRCHHGDWVEPSYAKCYKTTFINRNSNQIINLINKAGPSWGNYTFTCTNGIWKSSPDGNTVKFICSPQ